MEPLSNGHVGTRHFVLYREVVLSSEVRNVLYRKVELWDLKVCPLWRGFFSIVSFIRSVLYRRLHCNTSGKKSFLYEYVGMSPRIPRHKLIHTPSLYLSFFLSFLPLLLTYALHHSSSLGARPRIINLSVPHALIFTHPIYLFVMLRNFCLSAQMYPTGSVLWS